MESPESTPVALLSALVLEDGALWGVRATTQQHGDAVAMLAQGPEVPRMHYLTRPRGGSKTTDAAGVALAALLTQAPDRSSSHAYGRDRDQAALLVDAVGGLVVRTGLAGLVDVGSWSVVVKATGARLVVESADAASAYGHLPYFVVVDELAQWPSTRSSQALWEALVSGLPKRADSRLVVITTAGDPVHWSARVLDHARKSARWRVSEMPGPLAWSDPEDLAEQARLLPASAFERLHLNRWTGGEDRLVTTEDLAACVALDGPLDPSPLQRYVIGLDIGLTNDRTVLAVCHAERSDFDTSPRVVLDRLHVLAGARERPVQLADVESVAYEAATSYRARIRMDPWQGIGLAQRLRTRGVAVEEWSFTPASVGRLAGNLHLLLREHRLALPDDQPLLDELATVRLRETMPGFFRLDHDSGRHDDRAVALGLAALALTESAAPGRGSITVPTGTVQRALVDARPRAPLALALRRAARVGPAVPGGAILFPGTANDPHS